MLLKAGGQGCVNIKGAAPALAAITSGVADGSLTLEEASQLVKSVEVCASVLNVAELNARVEALEAVIKKGDQKMRSLENRIKLIEEFVSREGGKLVKDLMYFAIAQYLGNPQEGESLRQAFGRAIGLAPFELWRPFEKLYDDDRYWDAWRRLIEKFGKTDDVFDRIESGLSDDIKERWRCVQDASVISLRPYPGRVNLAYLRGSFEVQDARVLELGKDSCASVGKQTLAIRRSLRERRFLVCSMKRCAAASRIIPGRGVADAGQRRGKWIDVLCCSAGLDWELLPRLVGR
jgi:hypothetical protein